MDDRRPSASDQCCHRPASSGHGGKTGMSRTQGRPGTTRTPRASGASPMPAPSSVPAPSGASRSSRVSRASAVSRASGAQQAARTTGAPYGEPVLSSLTLRNAPFEARLRAAAGSGFRAIGLGGEDYLRARATGLSDDDMLFLLDHWGVRVAEVEFLQSWVLPERQPAAARERDEAVFRAARVFGAERINAGLFGHHPFRHTVDAFTGVCRRAARDGATVALEFMPYSGIPTLGLAARIVAEAGRPNAGLLIDAWHYARAGTSPGALAAVPAERIVSVQLDDALPLPLDDLRHESRHHRLLPGEGALDLVALLDRLREHGVSAPVAVEVMSDELDASGPRTAAARAWRTTNRVLREAGWPNAAPSPGPPEAEAA